MSDGVRVVDRVFDIFEVLATHKNGASLSQIAATTGMSKSTVHRLLSTMTSRQYVERNEDGSYTLGYKFIETASNHINNLELITEAKPLLSRMRMTAVASATLLPRPMVLSALPLIG